MQESRERIRIVFSGKDVNESRKGIESLLDKLSDSVNESEFSESEFLQSFQQVGAVFVASLLLTQKGIDLIEEISRKNESISILENKILENFPSEEVSAPFAYDLIRFAIALKPSYPDINVVTFRMALGEILDYHWISERKEEKKTVLTYAIVQKLLKEANSFSLSVEMLFNLEFILYCYCENI